jgi:hypothetical protein
MENLIPWRIVRRWECKHCGMCCSELDVPLTEKDELLLKEFWNISWKSKLGVYLKKRDGKCIFYDGGCKIYSIRPIACRKYPFYLREKGCELSEYGINGKKVHVFLDKFCSGIGCGKDVQSEIERVISELKAISSEKIMSWL